MHIDRLSRQVAILEQLAGVSEQVAIVQPHIVAALSPSQHPQLALERVGSHFDGGYVLPRRIVDAARGVVSIGVGDNNEVDLELADRGLRVHAWDHTVAGLPRSHELITFHRVGVGAIDGSGLKTLEEITDASFGAEASGLVLLMDAEGAEWDVFSTVADEVLGRYTVISLELHDLGNALLPGSPVLQVLSRLRSSFVPVAVHANNHSASWRSGDFVLPDALEVTYVRSDLMPEGAHPGNCPPSLLAPCCPDVAEIELNW